MLKSVRSLRRAGLGTFVALGLFGVSACGGDAPSAALEIPGEIAMRAAEVGASKADVLNLLPQGPLEMGTGASAASTLRGYPLDRFLIDGSWVEVLWLIPLEGEAEALPYRETRTPVIFRDEFFDGWGWAHFETRGGDWGLQAPVRSDPVVAPTDPEGDAGAGAESDGTPPVPVREGQSTTDEETLAGA